VLHVQVESWLFGAGIFVPFWKAAGTEGAMDLTADSNDEVPAHVAESWGYRFAQKLLRETILAHVSSCQLASS
jgi:hypothetical protein